MIKYRCCELCLKEPLNHKEKSDVLTGASKKPLNHKEKSVVATGASKSL